MSLLSAIELFKFIVIFSSKASMIAYSISRCSVV